LDNLKEETALGDLFVAGTIILKKDIEDVTGFILLRIVSNGGLL